MAQQSSFDLLCVDDFYFSALFNEDGESIEDQAFPISDAKYAEGLQFQEAIMASLITSLNSNKASKPPALTLESTPAAELVVVGRGKEIVGESSHCFCDICAERKESEEMFRIENCRHSFCSDCIGKHVAAKIQDSITMVACPGLDCDAILELESCRSMIPEDVVARWDEALCESLILASQKFYCPFRDCSAMLVSDGDETIRESECPICRRLFCARCYVPWHAGVECEELQRLNVDERGREDLMVRELAREKHWMRCPYCKFYVEKTEGCLHMTCRCGFQFCYKCGAKWNQTHGGC